MKRIKALILTAFAVAALGTLALAQTPGSITGQVQDSFGAVIVGATVTVVDSTGRERTTTSNATGNFTVSGLAPGRYNVKVFAENFGLYDNTEVDVTANQATELFVPLQVELQEEQVDVLTNEGVSVDPDSNLGATVLRGADLEALPDDPDELEAALQALAGPSSGPDGGQIYIDGFTGGRLPPREAIREIRINQNPFSAEYDRLGFGRIEILTRPGSDQWRGSAFFNFNDSRLNSRNPFALNRAPGQTRFYGGNISGPIQKGRSSFFLDISNREIDSNSVINALILDPNLNEIPFQQEIQVPTRRLSISPRFDYAINNDHTLVFRYSFTRSRSENQGIGGLTLPSRAFESSSTGHEFRITHTAILNPTTINETRFQYEWEDRERIGDNSIPAISVGSAFVGGGATLGFGFDKRNYLEIQNYTTMVVGSSAQHSLKFGGKIARISIRDRSENNFGGSFSFLNLDSYRQAILGNAIPLQFTITTGTPEIDVTRVDYGLFITDDWRINPGLTLSFGLRYENQTNISDNMNFAPRFSVAWAPGAGGARAPKTVIRGGFGLFYNRFSENLTLQALRFNGTNQLNLIVNPNDPDPDRRAAALALLSQPVFTVDGVTNVPTAADVLAALPQANTIRQISPDLKSPYTAQIALGVERQLPMRSNVSVFYIGARTYDVLRIRNVNAPICPEQMNCFEAPRPFPGQGDIYEYESTGRADQNQLMVNFRSNLHQRVSLFGNYRLGFANNDTDGAGSFPAYSYELADEYGRASFDIRHFFTIGGNINLPWGVSASPFVNINSGRPFNLTRGIDANSDGIFTERPTFGELGARCDELGLNYSYCDVAGEDPNAIIPRNFGRGPMSFTTNLRFNKTFGFGSSPEPAGGATTGQTGAPPTGGIPVGRGGRGGGGMRGGGGFGGGGRAPYNLTVGLNIQNVFNTVNFNPPVGNLSSSRFGEYTSTGGGWGFGGGGGSANRRVELSARFSW